MARNNAKPSWISTLIGWVILTCLLWWGGTGLYGLWVRPKMDLASSLGWIVTPCRVTQSTLKETPKNKDSLIEYTPTIQYEYQFNNQAYSSTRVWFGSPSTRIRKDASEIVMQYSAGENYECYVQPSLPTEAVLVRKINPVQGYGVIIGFILTGIGLMMLVTHIAYLISIVYRGIVGKTASEINMELAMANAACPIESGEPDEPLVIKASESRVAVAVGLWIFGLFWNGITWAIALGTLGKQNWGPFFFLAIFILLGLAILIAAIYATLQIFNPRPILVCSQRDIYPGSEFELSWMFKGNVHRIQHLEIVLEGIEEAKYREGTNTRTDKATFFKQQLVASEEADKIAQGFELISIPVATMHSFKSTNNSFTWQIRVNGKIAFWPDIRDRFDIMVLAPLVAPNNRPDV